MAQPKQQSFSDLLDQMNALKSQLNSQAQERVDAIKAELEEISAVTGKSIPQLLGISTGASSTGGKGRAASGKTPTAAKFRHPENPEMTYSGRGRKPGWFQEYLDNGGKEEDLLIDA